MQVSAYEAMKGKIRAAEMFHGKHFSNEVKNTSALILKNTTAVLESIEGNFGGNSMVANMNPVGSYKNFIIKVASLAIPALDVFDWVHVEAMGTAQSQILFTRYRRLSNKGASKQNDIISDPFGVYYRENADGTRENAIDGNYMSEDTFDKITVTADNAGTTLALRWTPVREVVSVTVNGTAYTKAADAANIGATEFALVDGKLTLGTATTAGQEVYVVYKWDNKYLPSEDIPTIGVKVEAIPLMAKPHKLRIVFDALDNLIYKNDYQVDISKELPKKAIEDFMFSVATKVSDEIIKNAPESADLMPFSLTAPDGWIAQHFAAFGSVLNAAQAAITKVTNIYAGNRCFVGTRLVPVVMATPGFKQADVEGKIGTQLIGSIGNLKIYHKPDMDSYTYVVFAKGQGAELSVGVLGIYLAALPASIIPTQLLEYADGMNVQGFYSLYDYVHVNPLLSVKGHVTH
ncbi:MAG: hypothetical protein NC218_02500 [Acetobacter sp.]|nr:hypothetical protein [Acetobacter sp.]